MAEPADDAPAAGLRSRYEAFRSLLDRNGTLLELLAELELDLRMLVAGDSRIWARLRRLLEGALLQIQTLNLLSGGRYGKLYRVHDRIENQVWSLLRRFHEECRNAPLIVPLAEATREDDHVVGGKAARLGDLAGGRPESVPAGFVVTTPAYSRFLAHGEASARLREILQDLDVIADPAQLKARVARARDLVLAQPVPEEVSRAIEGAARRLRVASAGGRWAVRSSAVGEDGPVSFAGQFDSILEVPEDGIVAAECFEEVLPVVGDCGIEGKCGAE